MYEEVLGEGHIVIFGFDATRRFQNHGNFALIWNALMNWNDLDIELEPELDFRRSASSSSPP